MGSADPLDARVCELKTSSSALHWGILLVVALVGDATEDADPIEPKYHREAQQQPTLGSMKWSHVATFFFEQAGGGRGDAERRRQATFVQSSSVFENWGAFGLSNPVKKPY